jgi:FkbH-like protein
MYEAELNRSSEQVEILPVEIRSQSRELIENIDSRTLLPWGEHCTECNWPTCYSTCELYSPRKDGACRLFVDGVTRIDINSGLNPYWQKIRFKRWAKLWTVGNLRLFSLRDATRKERANIRIGAVAQWVPLPPAIKKRLLTKIGYRRRTSAERALASKHAPDYFMIECYNPNSRTIDLTFAVRPREKNAGQGFQKLISVPQGFKREKISAAEIFRNLDTGLPFEIEIVPNDCDNTILYFGTMDFVRDNRKQELDTLKASKEKKWKCLVWDLDNTLWDGILVEDGADKLKLRQEAIEVIRETDKRGILHSIASKNNREDALNVLRSNNLLEYFLHPQISWQPKSIAVARIAQLLNIGVDTLAFVDDQPFEREEVKVALPQVAVIDARDCGIIPGLPQCQVPVTEESRQRRQMYRQQEQRDAILETFSGDYMGFLKECDIQMNIRPLNEQNLDRVYELAQRTNQMNFSGNRYPLSELRAMSQRDSLETYVMKCSDKFGSYGIVGFAVVEIKEPRLKDLMFSCRIQSKRVEHAFLSSVLNKYVAIQSRNFFADYRKTDKNAPAGKVFEEMGFELIGENSGVQSMLFRRGRSVPDDGIITIVKGTPD